MSIANPPTPKTKSSGEFNHPIYDELAFPTDPNNLYRQTVGSMLQGADLMDLPTTSSSSWPSPRTRSWSTSR